ncbi:MAG: hypothetical protein O3C40_20010 [Planctomycetota bacterium]|nr:hypothetical protein [Planctomycetota bacterium]
MSREYALALRNLVDCLDKFRTINFSPDATRDPSLPPDRSAVSIGGYVHDAIQDVARHCPTGQLPQELRTNWHQLCQSKDNDDDRQWQGMAYIESQSLRTWAYGLYRGECRMRLTIAGEPVLVPDGSDPDGPEARRMENLSFAELLRRVSDPEVEYDDALVDMVIEWLEQGHQSTVRRVQLSAAVHVERTYRKRAAELLPGYSGPDDTYKIAALVCKHCNLQPSEFNRMNVRERTPFVEMALAATAPQIPLSADHTPGDSATTTKTERLTKALLLLKQNPEWTNERIAEEVGTSPGTLSRWPEFRRAVEILAEDGKRKLPRGWKTDDDIEAIDD